MRRILARAAGFMSIADASSTDAMPAPPMPSARAPEIQGVVIGISSSGATKPS